MGGPSDHFQLKRYMGQMLKNQREHLISPLWDVWLAHLHGIANHVVGIWWQRGQGARAGSPQPPPADAVLSFLSCLVSPAGAKAL